MPQGAERVAEAMGAGSLLRGAGAGEHPVPETDEDYSNCYNGYVTKQNIHNI